MSYQETIDYLYGLQKHGIKLGLSNSAALMELMGSPHSKFRSLHIAGTNGKGSTAAFLSGILQAAGFRTGLYTSPHLISFTERIRVNGEQIAEDRVVELARRVRDAYRDLPASHGQEPLNPTFFEVTTAMAFTYFAEKGVDIAVVEVGMGGRLDSTNVITPLVSLITNIDLEHTEFLGDTLEKIAREKAGIIKEAVPVVTGVSQPEVIATVSQQAAVKRSPLYRLEKDFTPENIRRGADQVFDYRGMETTYPSLRIRMPGGYQIHNACLAVAAVECMKRSGLIIGEAAIRRGLESTVWEGRLERVSKNPDIYLDGAHNPASARELVRAMREMRRAYERIILIIGILADKDYRGIVSELVPIVSHVVVTRPQYSRAMEVSVLASEIRSLHHSVDTAETVGDAIAAARAMASERDLILITGSLYVVGDARAVLVQNADSAQAFKGLKG